MSTAEILEKKESKILRMQIHSCNDHEEYINKCCKCKLIYTRFNGKRQRESAIHRGIQKQQKIEQLYNGLTYLEYHKMLTEQNSACAICSFITTDLHVDHNHDTLKVRALLCPQCNQGIGHFYEKVEVLHEAIEYLKQSH